MSINLLPTELRPKSYALKLSVSLRKIAIISTIVFLVVSTFLTAAYLLIGNRANASLKKQDDLKRQIKTYEDTEKKLVLIEDRLDKIKTISKSENVNDELAMLKNVIINSYSGAYIKDVELKTDKAVVLVVAGSSLDITNFFRSLLQNNEFSLVTLEQLKFSPSKGYEVELSLVK